MSNSRSGWPLAPDFHPEFGLLCPSRRRRRALRLGTIAVLATLAIGATMGLAVAHRTDAKGLAAASLTVEEQPPARSFDISANSGELTRTQASCQAGTSEDLAALFLNPSCGARKPHAKHGARETNRVATVILGRMDAK
jgi:uncharacterized low-complexity protein